MASDAKRRPPTPPRPLGKAGRRLWRSVHESYELESHERELLLEACTVLDTIDQLQAVVDRDGPTTLGSAQQVVAHPCLLECRQQRIAFARLVGQLGLPDVDGSATTLSGVQARSRAGHRQRWGGDRVS